MWEAMQKMENLLKTHTSQGYPDWNRQMKAVVYTLFLIQCLVFTRCFHFISNVRVTYVLGILELRFTFLHKFFMGFSVCCVALLNCFVVLTNVSTKRVLNYNYFNYKLKRLHQGVRLWWNDIPTSHLHLCCTAIFSNIHT